MSHRWFVCLLVVCTGVSSALAEGPPLSLGRVVELARTQAPATVIARARTEEARAGLVGASRFATRNPVLEADVGPRWSDGRSTDAQASLSVPLDLGGRRDKRVSLVEAEIRREQHLARDAERLTIGIAVTTYYQALYADRRYALAEERVRLAESAEATARQRNRAGDVAEFEVNLARGEVARAKSGVAAAQSEQTRARGKLAVTLGLSSVSIVGELGDRSFLDIAVAKAGTRADLRAVAEEVQLAQSEATVARSGRWPSLDVRFTYEHERDTDIVLGGIAIAIPLVERGQGDEARARARANRAAAELATRTAWVGTEVSGARNTYASAITAARILETDAVPLSLENETAAAASYRAGKIDLGSLLLIRREALDTRREHLDRLLDAAFAAVDLWIARGTDPGP
ncbi:MAG: TolC family protein [Kofleriaceae bacterium]